MARMSSHLEGFSLLPAAGPTLLLKIALFCGLLGGVGGIFPRIRPTVAWTLHNRYLCEVHIWPPPLILTILTSQ
jgi:hypothetical protein